MEHRGDQFDCKTTQEKISHKESEVVEFNNKLSQESKQTEIKCKSVLSRFIKDYIYEKPEISNPEGLESSHNDQHEIDLKSLAGGFIGTYILFLILFEVFAFSIASWARANTLALFFLCLTGLVFALLVAFYIGQKEIPKEDKYEELYSQFIASAIFFAIVIPLIPFMIYFGLCSLLFYR